MKPNIVILKDTLILKDSKTYICYSPFTGKITRIKEFPKENTELYNCLLREGLFAQVPDIVKINTTWDSFYSMTLLLTRKCNLNCIYCYASALPKGESMSEELAIGSTEWFLKNLKQNLIRVVFHGGGEPTLEQKIIKKIVSLVNMKKEDKKTRFVITTNGVVSESFLKWMIDNEFGISISADGPPSIQDRNRPLAITGGKSSEIVENSIRFLVDNKYPFSVRVTFSTSDKIEEIINYFGSLGVKKIHLEPLFPHGRNYKKVDFKKNNPKQIKPPRGLELSKLFLKAVYIAEKYNMKIYNGHLLYFTKGTNYFCGAASAKSMVVTHDGFLTGCLEVVDKYDQNASFFLFGRYNFEKHDFEIDQNKIKSFQKRHFEHLLKCKNCFARYHCAGGCSVKAVRASENFYEVDPQYCSFTKSIVPKLVHKIALDNDI